MAGLAAGGDQHAGQQVFGAGVVGLDPAGFEALQDGLGLGVGDQRLVSISLHQPLRPRPALHAALVAAVCLLIVDVPDCVPGIGEGVPFDSVQAGSGEIQPELLGQTGSGQSLCAPLQIDGNLGCVLVRDELRLGHRLAFPDRAGGDVLQGVAEWGASAGAKPPVNVLCHSGQPFYLGQVAVHLIHGVQHGRHDDGRNPVQLRQHRKDDVDASLLAFVLEDDGHILISGQARSVEHDDRTPLAILAVYLLKQALEVWGAPVCAFDRVGEFLNYNQVARLGQRPQLAALGVDRHIRPVLAAA